MNIPYRRRLLEDKLSKIMRHFSAVIITGARQVGKSTLLSHHLPHVNHITFDPIIDIANAKRDPELFVNQLTLPVILDEIQFTPEILSLIKRKIDQQKKVGQYYLTGSQNFSVMQHVAESLAGRIAVLTLGTLSVSELTNHPTCWLNSFVNNPTAFLKNPAADSFFSQTHHHYHYSLIETLWRGFYPGLLNIPNELLQDTLESYFKTYVERDVRLLVDIQQIQEFSRFVALIANLTAQEINFSELGREIQITPQTAKRWLDVLIACYQWTSIPAFSNNTIKRISQKPKGYITDTGMACMLMHIGSTDSLKAHPKAGALFETLVVQDILKQLPFIDGKPAVYHWRSHSGAEVDLLIEVNNQFFPIEIKYKSNPTTQDARGIVAFRETYPHLNIAPGIILSPVQHIYAVAQNCYVVPFDLIMQL